MIPRTLAIDDDTAWNSSVDKLFPLLCDGSIELIGLVCGRSRAEPIQPHSLALVRLLSPFKDWVGVNSSAHIVTFPFVDDEHWRRGFNDQLYHNSQVIPAWTHLQVRKADVLSLSPKPTSTVKSEGACYDWLCEQMVRALEVRPKPRAIFADEAMKRFHPLSKRQFDRAWRRAIDDTGARAWSRPGAPKKAPGR